MKGTLHILNPSERTKVREAWAGHPLFEVCKVVFLDREVRLEAADVKSEDIFYAVATLLDELWSNDHLTQRDIDNLWRMLYKVIRAYQLDATEPDKRQVAHTVFTIAAKALCHHWRTLYCDTYFYMLQHTMDTEMQKADSEERNRFVELLIEESSSLSEWVNNVYDGTLGKEIEEKLKTEDTPIDCNINVFNDRLNQQAIVKAIKELNRGNLGEVNFAYAVHTFFESVNWLSSNIDTRFVLWMKANGLMKVGAKDLKQAKAQDSRVISLMNDMRSVFQEKHPRTDNWRDKKEYFNPNRKLINKGD